VNGHFVSGHIKDYLVDFLSKKENYDTSDRQTFEDKDFIYSKVVENDYELLKKAYLKAECSLFNLKFECGFSGCTAVTVIMIGEKIICANAGDSRALMVTDAQINGNTLFKEGAW